jgi:hypothetical protein
LQDQINEKNVALYIKGGKVTGHVLAQAMRAFLKKAREPPKGKSGKQSIKSLTKQGASLSNIEITGSNIGSFSKIARKYNVDFALQRDDSKTPPGHIVFFKAKDVDALTAAFNEYSKSQIKVKSATKTPLLTQLDKYKEIVKAVAAPVKNRSKGEIEH